MANEAHTREERETPACMACHPACAPFLSSYYRKQRAMNGGESSIDDFDLFWGMGPSPNDPPPQLQQQIQHQQHLGDPPGLAVSSSVVSNISTPSRSGGLGSGLVGGLWSHETLESYGHRHHVHLQTDVLNDGGGVSSIGGGGLASPTQQHQPHQHQQASNVRRSSAVSAWPSTSPTDPSRTRSSSRDESPLHMHRQRPRTGGVVGVAGAGDIADLRNLSPPTAAAAGPYAPDSHSGSIVDSKLEELAAAISSSVLGKLDVGVMRGTLLSQRGAGATPGSPPIRSAAISSDAAAAAAAAAGVAQGRAAETAVAPLRSRLSALEEQVAELRAALERKNNTVTAAHGPRMRSLDHFVGESDLRVSSSTRGHHPGGRAGRGVAGGSGGNGSGSGGGGGIGNSGNSLEQSLSALAQRTGTLEGRHKQVQAKVALLDSAFGSKASDWAQTVRDILVEREAAAGGGASGGTGKTSASSSRAGNKGGKRSSASASARTTPAAPVAQSSLGEGCIEGRVGGANSNTTSPVCGIGVETSQQPRKSGPGAGVPEACAADSAAGAEGGGNAKDRGGSHDDASPRAPGVHIYREDRRIVISANADPTHANVPTSSPPPPPHSLTAEEFLAGAEGTKSTRNSVAPIEPSAIVAVAGEPSSTPIAPAPTSSASESGGMTPPVDASEVPTTRGRTTGKPATCATERCPACVETEERCSRMEARTSEFERVLRVLREEVESATGHAAAAAAAAAATATVAEGSRSKAVDAAASASSMKTEIEASNERLKAAAAANLSNSSAFKSLADKLASDVKQLSERTKEGEDALALVDHGLKGLRDEVNYVRSFVCARMAGFVACLRACTKCVRACIF